VTRRRINRQDAKKDAKHAKTRTVLTAEDTENAETGSKERKSRRTEGR
jgi:hypothetical protein